MEALTISAANLDAIERNLGAVASELSGVINNVSGVNEQVNKVEAKVASLNDEIKSLVREIRETSIITNARQSIMYNNEIIEKKFGYYDQVRRKTEALLDAIEHSNISITALENLKHDLILNNPNYWLSNALASLTSWVLDDQKNTERELNNALKKDSKKTSIFFALVNLKLGRTQTSLNWLNKYLSEQNPLNIDKDFITVLDLIANGEFGSDARISVLNKINEWFRRLNSDKDLQEKQVDFFLEYISSNEESEITMPYLDTRTPDIGVLKSNLTITSSYFNVYNDLKDIIKKERTNKTSLDVLRDLIYDYESKEQTYQKENLKNNLIIACNGNREEAMRLYEKQEKVYDEQTDMISMLSNIVVYKDNYNVSNETQKIALSLVSNYIIEAYNRRNSKIDLNPFNIVVQGFRTLTSDGKNSDQINNELNNYLHETYDKEDKDLIIALLAINIIGIIGIFITLNSRILSTILILILIIGNIALFLKLNKRKNSRDQARNITNNMISGELEKVLAEVIDYKNIISDDMTKYEELIRFINNLKAENYITHNNERNINIGG